MLLGANTKLPNKVIRFNTFLNEIMNLANFPVVLIMPLFRRGLGSNRLGENKTLADQNIN